ncbi:WD repeat-containing protein 44 [Echria macrotheca]|uniref:WD repeat-containing protein 44 n=1 Tax=Echria macrotheca TaxID=438768 RepID=A0AAJ0F7L1_9PEZI|nr:WD repeat-containing protein 44 [Echria macrotheca]
MEYGTESGADVRDAGASPASATPAPGKKTPSSRLSRSNTASAWKEKDRDRDDSDVQNAEDAVRGPNIARATPPPTVQPPIGSAIDPLSQHIFQRTNSDHPIPRRRLPSRPDSPAPAIEGLLSQPNVDQGAKAIAPAGDGTKDKSKKGPSFLSRLGMRGIKKKDAGEIDSESEIGSEARMDGINALVFSQSLASPFGGAGYTPRHKEPPRYIRTKANNKPAKEFNRMFLAQELVGTNPPKLAGGEEPGTDASRPPDVTVSVAGADGRKVTRTGGAIWATEFSKDGKYLATAGRDHVVRIWAVISTPEERRACEEEEAANGATGERLSAPVFRGRPVRELDGHTGEILDLSWSKNNFLLSSSMDKTVRLWHISRSDCLCTFKHKDFVTRLAFHPQDDRFFLAGSLDTMLRLWSIPDKAIAYSEQLPDLVTAVAFSPDGRTAIAGLLNGLCLFYETDGLKFQNQIHVRSSRGKNAKGSKITSIQTISIPPPNPLDHSQTMSGSVSQASADLSSQAEVAVLITSNDSRIRIYSLREKVLDIKLKGHENVCSQIGATFSDDGKYVICGSEDRKAFIWSLVGSAGSSKSEGKPAYEYFDAHGTMVTTALFAPTRTRMLLGQSGDPLYDLCNPPPVVLRSLEETTSAVASQTGLSADELHHSVSPEASKKPEPSAAYIARSTHYDGNIIVTTDDTGIIKVFRQDCAYTKRRSDNWETGSTLSRKLTAHGTFKSSGMARSGSILTRTSASSAAHSRRGSLSQSVASSAMASPKFPPGPSNSDRILSWRQSIEHGSDRRSSAIAHDGMTPTRTERSTSPTKANRNVLGSSAANLASDARKQPYGNSSPAGPRVGSTVASPTASMFSNTPERMPARIVTGKTQPAEDAASPPIPTPSFTFRPADQDEQSSPTGSGSFWNLSRWRGKAGSKSGTGQGQVSGHTRAPSSGSLLSRSPMTMEHLGDGAEKEPETKGAKEKGKDKRRQSLGFFGSVEPSDSSRRKSLPSPSIGQAASDSDIRSIPTINVPLGEEEIHPESNPVRLKRDVSPYRHLWSRDSRQSSELSGDIEEEEESAEETVCRQCGGREFKVRKVAGKQRLSCGRCGMLVD